MKLHYYCMIFIAFSASAMLQRNSQELAIPSPSDTSPLRKILRPAHVSLSTRNLETHELQSLITRQILQGLQSRISRLYRSAWKFF